MNDCCKKNARGLLIKLARQLDEGITELGGGCSRCGKYITAKLEGVDLLGERKQ